MQASRLYWALAFGTPAILYDRTWLWQADHAAAPAAYVQHLISEKSEPLNGQGTVSMKTGTVTCANSMWW